jgi:hypothetical protein
MSARIVVRRAKKNEPVLWIVDSEQWPRVLIRAELIERGYDPYGFILLTDALDAYKEGKAAKPRVLVLELRGQELTDNTLREIARLNVPVILLGSGSDFRDPAIGKFQCVHNLKRPFSVGQVVDLVQTLCPDSA